MKSYLSCALLSIGLSFSAATHSEAMPSHCVLEAPDAPVTFADRSFSDHSADWIEKLITGQSPLCDADGTPRGPLSRDKDLSVQSDAYRRTRTTLRHRNPQPARLTAD